MAFSVSWLRGQLRYSGIFFGRRCTRLVHRKPVISFTFDDFPRSALHTGGDILQEYGARGTYYAALGLMDTDGPVGRMFSEQDLGEVVTRGHELGCHTFDHCHAWNTDPKSFENSILKNREALNQLLPGVSFETLSYPLGVPRPQTKRRVEKYFLGCRGCTQKINSGVTDLNFLKAYFLEQSGGEAAVKEIIDRNCRDGGWLILATHDVTDNPTRFGYARRLFKAIVQHAATSGATILPVAAALKGISLPSEQIHGSASANGNKTTELAARKER